MTKESPDWRTEARRRWQQLCTQFKLRNLAANELAEKTKDLVAARDAAREHLRLAEQVIPSSRAGAPTREEMTCSHREALELADRRLAEHQAMVAASLPPFDVQLFNRLDAAIKQLDSGVKPGDRIGDAQ